MTIQKIMKNNKFIIITSINEPTLAIREYAKWEGWTTVVVGDRKSPKDWHCDGVVFLSLDDQFDQFPSLSALLPENTYVRKMFGYIYAMRNKAIAVFETDDDNIPYPDAKAVVESDLLSKKDISCIRSEGGWVNVYKEFGAETCWPRGYPLQALRDKRMAATKSQDSLPWGVIQYLADEDPDVDAIYRMTRSEPIYFARNRTFCLERKTYSPFNSQATLWLPEFFPLMFLPVGISDRVTDILRGYMSLACLWECKRTLRLSSPVVYQQRNPHNLQRDFEQEVNLYLHGDRWSKLLMGVEGLTPTQAFCSAIAMLIKDGAIPQKNEITYEAFLKESVGNNSI